MSKFSLSQTLDSKSYEFISANFKFERIGEDIVGWNAYGQPGETSFVKFFANGSAAYSPTGSVRDMMDFSSHQDAADFIQI